MFTATKDFKDIIKLLQQPKWIVPIKTGENKLKETKEDKQCLNTK